MPSLHAAYPVITYLFLAKQFPKFRLLLIIYLFSVWLSIMYLGEHYTFDIFMGAIYAMGAFLLVMKRKNIYKYLKQGRRILRLNQLF